MIRLETFGTVHTHTIHLENVWQVFAMPIATSHIITQTYAHKCAKIVEKLLCHTTKTQNSARINAANNIERTKKDLQPFAKSVERHLAMAEKQAQKESFAAIHAPQDTITSIVPVNNITVKDAGCYYANNILVSNCDTLTGIIEKEILNKPQGIRRRN